MIRIKGRVIFDWISDDYLIPQKWETHRSISMVEKFFNYDTFRSSNTNDLDSNEYYKTAAEKGIPEALFKLGLLYDEGKRIIDIKI